MDSLTKKQDKILEFIEDFQHGQGHSPSYQEIQEHFGFHSPNAVTNHIRAIKRKGYIQERKGHRGIASLRPARNEIPLVGEIAAGSPIEAIENIEKKLDLSAFGFDNSGRDYLALSVKGDSMVNANIQDGDTVIVKKQKTFSKRDICAVLVENEATIKYVEKSRNGYRLIPANDSMRPVEVNKNKTADFSILGKVVFSCRKH